MQRWDSSSAGRAEKLQHFDKYVALRDDLNLDSSKYSLSRGTVGEVKKNPIEAFESLTDPAQDAADGNIWEKALNKAKKKVGKSKMTEKAQYEFLVDDRLKKIF